MNTSTATQTRHPWRATARTVFAFLVSHAVVLPVVAAQESSVSNLPYASSLVAIAGVVTRVLAIPAVDTFLRTYLPFLSAQPKANR
jgi:uncharacterized membrane protein YagU involved in acid resistance